MAAKISDETRVAILRALDALPEKPVTKDFQRIADSPGINVSVTTVRKVWFEAHPAPGSPEGETEIASDSGTNGDAQALDAGGLKITPPEIPEKDMPPITATSPPAQSSAAGGKPAQQSGAQVAPQTLEVDTLVDTICTMFDARATKAPEESPGGEAEPEPRLPLKITKEEKAALSRAWGAFAIKYAPQIAAHIVEINMLVVTVGVFGPRLWQVYEFNQYRERKRQSLREESGTSHGIPHAPVEQEDDAAIARRLDRKLRSVSAEVAYA